MAATGSMLELRLTKIPQKRVGTHIKPHDRLFGSVDVASGSSNDGGKGWDGVASWACLAYPRGADLVAMKVNP